MRGDETKLCTECGNAIGLVECGMCGFEYCENCLPDPDIYACDGCLRELADEIDGELV